MGRSSLPRVVLLGHLLLGVACGPAATEGTGGSTATGGATASGGKTGATGGAPAASGGAGPGTGGAALGTGGATSSGGRAGGTGGTTGAGTGGAPGSGGATGAGGRAMGGGGATATGGRAMGNGGATATGGRAMGGGGATGTGGRAMGTGGATGAGGATAVGGSAGSCVANLACKPNPPATTGDLHQDCVDRINQFLTQCACLPALARATEGEACADQMAEYDAGKNTAHAGFEANLCKPSGSQNECPGYSSNSQVIGLCMQQMWDEGPPPAGSCTGTCYEQHGHFINMTDKSVHKVACGFFTTSAGKVWAAQNFF